MNGPLCPHCGAESANFVLSSMPPKYPFKCGSYEGYRSPQCKKGEEQKIQKGPAMSDTPETDAKEWPIWPTNSHGEMFMVPSDFARKLERERNEARAIAEKFRTAFRIACNRLNKTQNLFPWEESK